MQSTKGQSNEIIGWERKIVWIKYKPGKEESEYHCISSDVLLEVFCFSPLLFPGEVMLNGRFHQPDGSKLPELQRSAWCYGWMRGLVGSMWSLHFTAKFMIFPVQLNRLILFSIIMMIMIMPLYHHELSSLLRVTTSEKTTTQITLWILFRDEICKKILKGNSPPQFHFFFSGK